jgi:hypothetical protein
MTDDQIVGLVVQGGIGATALAILGKIALKVADRMIGAIDALSKEARDTGKATVDALSSLTDRLSRLEGKVEILASVGGDTGPVQQQWADSEVSEVRRARARSPEPGAETGYGPLKPRR